VFALKFLIATTEIIAIIEKEVRVLLLFFKSSLKQGKSLFLRLN